MSRLYLNYKISDNSERQARSMSSFFLFLSFAIIWTSGLKPHYWNCGISKESSRANWNTNFWDPPQSFWFSRSQVNSVFFFIVFPDDTNVLILGPRHWPILYYVTTYLSFQSILYFNKNFIFTKFEKSLNNQVAIFAM